ncbi:T-cell-specific surface glycoprotein CD28-like [Mobula birostris]|uniref:T-cell-specific surface glycoprotein CD28-like n=1 Tax=Mobula birostris TaxID=1983395 RepID=UPI003B280094
MRNLWLFILSLPAVATLGGPHRSSSRPRFVTASLEGEASLLCGLSGTKTGEEFHVVLYKGVLNKSTEVCTAFFSNHTMQPSKTKDQFHCQVWLSPNNVTISIRDLNVSDTDRYICNVLKTYPPPFRKFTGQWVLIYVNQEVTSCPPEEENGYWLLLTVILTTLAMLLFLYGLSMTVVYCKYKMNNDRIYMNVRN